MIPPRDLLPGNADLVDIAVQLPRERRGSSWDVVWMVVVSVVLVSVLLYVTPQFEQLFKELGVQISRRTADVLQVWFHLVALVGLAIPCVWRWRVGKNSWATEVWFVLAMLYVGFVVYALFIPLVHLTSGGLGKGVG